MTSSIAKKPKFDIGGIHATTSTNFTEPLHKKSLMCTCLVNALRDGGIIISYHTVAETSLPMIEAPQPAPSPNQPQNFSNEITLAQMICNTSSTPNPNYLSSSSSSSPRTTSSITPAFSNNSNSTFDAIANNGYKQGCNMRKRQFPVSFLNFILFFDPFQRIIGMTKPREMIIHRKPVVALVEIVAPFRFSIAFDPSRSVWHLCFFVVVAEK